MQKQEQRESERKTWNEKHLGDDNTERNLTRQACAKVDEYGNPTTAVKQKADESEADTIKCAPGKEKEDEQPSQRRAKQRCSGSSQGPHMTK